MELNPKSRIYKNTNHFTFLGRTYQGKYAKYRDVKRKIKYKKFLYESGTISLNNFVSSMICFKSLSKPFRLNNFK